MAGIHGQSRLLPKPHSLTQSRLFKLLELVDQPAVLKWKLCTKVVEEHWVHPSGTFALLGDAVHATIPYAAAGAGMALEDGAVLGEAFCRLHKSPKPSASEVRRALSVYEECRQPRTKKIVERGFLQQTLYSSPDDLDQEERDRKLRPNPTPEGEAMPWRDPAFGPFLLGYDAKMDVQEHWC